MRVYLPLSIRYNAAQHALRMRTRFDFSQSSAFESLKRDRCTLQTLWVLAACTWRDVCVYCVCMSMCVRLLACLFVCVCALSCMHTHIQIICFELRDACVTECEIQIDSTAVNWNGQLIRNVCADIYKHQISELVWKKKSREKKNHIC